MCFVWSFEQALYQGLLLTHVALVLLEPPTSMLFNDLNLKYTHLALFKGTNWLPARVWQIEFISNQDDNIMERGSFAQHFQSRWIFMLRKNKQNINSVTTNITMIKIFAIIRQACNLNFKPIIEAKWQKETLKLLCNIKEGSLLLIRLHIVSQWEAIWMQDSLWVTHTNHK